MIFECGLFTFEVTGEAIGLLILILILIGFYKIIKMIMEDLNK